MIRLKQPIISELLRRGGFGNRRCSCCSKEQWAVYYMGDSQANSTVAYVMRSNGLPQSEPASVIG